MVFPKLSIKIESSLKYLGGLQHFKEVKLEKEQIHSRPDQLFNSCPGNIIYYFGVIAAQPAKFMLMQIRILCVCIVTTQYPHDQDLKPTVRDAVLAATNNLFSGAEKEVEAMILEHWELICTAPPQSGQLVMTTIFIWNMMYSHFRS